MTTARGRGARVKTTIVFVGPTLSADEVRARLPDADVRPPAGAPGLFKAHAVTASRPHAARGTALAALPTTSPVPTTTAGPRRGLAPLPETATAQ